MDMLRFSDRFQAVLSLFSPQIGWIITVVKWVGMLRFIQRKKFLFPFVSPIPFLHMVFPFGINRYRAGAKVWQRALKKSRAFGFLKNLHTVG